MQFTTIVVGYDGSDFAQDALDAAASLCDDDGMVHVVTAFDAPSIRNISAVYSAVPEEFTASIDLMSAQRAPLDKAETYLTDRGVAHEGHFLDDDPAAAILDVAESVDADLIVVGSRGLGRASRVIRGSVSSRVAAHAPHSFLVVHRDD